MSIHGLCPQHSLLQRFLDEKLLEGEAREVSAHLEACEQCQRAPEALAASDTSWSDLSRCLASGASQAAPDPAMDAALEQIADLARDGRTSAEPRPVEDDNFSFLDPAKEQGSLGRLGHYEILEVVGKGGMGVVFKAMDTSLHRVVAIKVLGPHLAGSGAARQRFVREARAAAGVMHENVIAIHAVEEHGPFPIS